MRFVLRLNELDHASCSRCIFTYIYIYVLLISKYRLYYSQQYFDLFNLRITLLEKRKFPEFSCIDNNLSCEKIIPSQNSFIMSLEKLMFWKTIRHIGGLLGYSQSLNSCISNILSNSFL